MSNYWKKKLDELNGVKTNKTSSETSKKHSIPDYWANKTKELEEANKKKTEIAPVKDVTVNVGETAPTTLRKDLSFNGAIKAIATGAILGGYSPTAPQKPIEAAKGVFGNATNAAIAIADKDISPTVAQGIVTEETHRLNQALAELSQSVYDEMGKNAEYYKNGNGDAYKDYKKLYEAKKQEAITEYKRRVQLRLEGRNPDEEEKAVTDKTITEAVAKSIITGANSAFSGDQQKRFESDMLYTQNPHLKEAETNYYNEFVPMMKEAPDYETLKKLGLISDEVELPKDPALVEKEKKEAEKKEAEKKQEEQEKPSYFNFQSYEGDLSLSPMLNKGSTRFGAKDELPWKQEDKRAIAEKYGIKLAEGETPAKYLEKSKFETDLERFARGLIGFGAGVIATPIDIADNAIGGVLKMAENVVDAGAYAVGGIGKATGLMSEETSERIKETIAADLVGEAGFGSMADNYSFLGEKTDSLTQSAAQLVAKAALQYVGVPWQVTTGVQSFGSGTEEAFAEGAGYGEAGIYGGVNAVAEIGSEALFKGSGLGEKGLINTSKLTNALTDKLKSGTAKALAKYSVDLALEGGEEVITSVTTNAAKALYKEESVWELITNDEALQGYLDDFVSGFVISGGMNAGKVANSINTKTDYNTGVTANEQKVIDKEIENRIAEAEADGKTLTKKDKTAIEEQVYKDLEKGYISTDTIESVLGGEAYNTYQDSVNKDNSIAEQEKAIEDEIAELVKTPESQFTIANRERLTELREMRENLDKTSNTADLKTKLDEAIANILKGERKGKGSMLFESYNEQTRRGKAFEADVSKYAPEQQAVIQKAIDSGILNNTNRTHDFVDMVAKISADKGVSFDFADNAKLKESGFVLDGKTVNGYVTKDGVTLNIDSHKALNTVVGREITHVLEGTELYTELQNTLFDYARAKGEYSDRLNKLTELYKGVKDADVYAELTADLAGDYLFSDGDFVTHLSTTKRNVFQKIYDEIKYLYKTATAGSEEARQLERVKRAFDKAYKESGKAVADTKYLLTQVDGIDYVKTDKSLFVKEDGTLASEREVFNSLVGKTIALPDGEIEIVKRLPDKDMYNELSKRYPKQLGNVENAKQLNSEVNYNMKELLENSEATTLNEPDKGNKHAKQGITSFDTRTVKFYDGNKAYDIEFSIATLQDGKKVAYAKKFFGYDAELTKKIQTAESRSNQSPFNQRSAVDNIISQNSEKSIENAKFSLSKDGEAPKRYGDYNVYGEDIRLEKAPAEELAPVQDGVQNNTPPVALFNKYSGKNGWGADYDMAQYALNDAVKYVSTDLWAAFNEEIDNTPENTNLRGRTPITNALIAVQEDVRQDTITPIQGARLLSEAYNSGGVEALKRLYNPRTGNLYDQYLEKAKQYDTIAPTEENAISPLPTTETKANTMENSVAEFADIAPITEEEANAMASESLDSLTDADVPPEVDAPYYAPREPITIDSEGLKKITDSVNSILYLNGEDSARMAEAIKIYAQNPNLTREQLAEHISKTYEVVEEIDNSEIEDELNQAKKHIRGTRIYVPEETKAEFNGRRKDGYNAFRQEHLGHFILTNNPNDMGIDSLYQELADAPENGGYPDLFPADIINPADQLRQIAEVASRKIEPEYRGMPYDEDTIQEAVNAIENGIAQYSQDDMLRGMNAEQDAISEFYGEKAIAPFSPNMEGIKTTSDEVVKDIAPTPPSAPSAPTAPTEEKIARRLPPKTAKEAKQERRKKNKGLWRWFRTNFIDKQSSVEKVSLKAKSRELMGKANFMLSSDARAQRFIAKGANGVRALNDIRKEVQDSGFYKEFENYLDHKHNVDRMSIESNAQARIAELKGKFGRLRLDQIWAISKKEITDKTTEKTAQTIREAKEYLNALEVHNKPVFGASVTAEHSRVAAAKLEAEHPQFVQWAQEIYSVNKYLRQMMVDNGIITQETADLWEKMYPHYVPTTRAEYNGAAINVPLDTNRTGVNAPIKGATGGNSDMVDTFEAIADRVEQTFRAVAKNNFGVELKNTLETARKGANKASGIIPNDTITDIDTLFDVVERHEELLKKGENGAPPTFTVFENGERVEFEITEDLYDALKPTSEGLKKKIPVVSHAANLHKKVLTEYNLAFAATNAIKDAQSVIVNSQHPVRTYLSFPEAVGQLIMGKGKWIDEYMANGGEDLTYFEGDTKRFKDDDTTFKKIVGLPLKGISWVNNFVERIPRLAEYIASRKAGASIEVAMLDAARVTTNFSAGGDVTRFLNKNGATFLNASVQGAAQQVRNIREAKAKGMKGVLGLVARYATAGLPVVLFNSLMWDDDEEYEELSDYVKDNYYVVGKFGDGQFVRIPKGREVAVIQKATELIANVITGEDEIGLSDIWDLGSFAMSNLAPNNPIDNNVISPIIQAHNNKAWHGGDIVPSRLQDVPADEQFDESIDAISKWLGEKTGGSPYKINYLLDQYTGIVGDMFLPMLTPEAEGGGNSVGDKLIAPIRDKFTTDSVTNNKISSDFYDTKDELTKNAKSIKATDEDILKNKYINSVNEEISELYKKQREIQNSGKSDSYKYNAVREVQEQINDLMRNSLDTYSAVNINNGYATVGDRQYRLNDKGEWAKLTDEQIEKQDEVTRGLGISASEYWGNKEEYDFAYEKPGKYAVTKAVGGYSSYKQYTGEIYDIKGVDLDGDGRSDSGTRKEKVIEYLNDLDIDYYEKLILFKSEYNADDTYNNEIVEYLNGREDISYEDTVTILKELGFKVDSKGNVDWD